MYTYDDIVTAKDILTGKVKKDDIIGKNGWLLDAIPHDMSLNVIARLGVHVCLMEINLENTAPFGDGGIPFTYFLPEKGKSYEERQNEWLKANDIGEGNKVRIVRKAKGYKDGWDNTWLDSMDDEVGKVGTVVEDRGDKGIVVDTGGKHWRYPYFVLEKVNDEPEKEESAPERRTWLEDIAYRLYECMHSRYVAFCKQDDYLTVSGFTYKPCFSEENGIWYPGKSEKWSMYDLSIPYAAYSDCPEEWKVDGKVDFSKAIIDMVAGEGPSSIKRDEDEPEYVPFDLSDPKDRDFLRGKWIKRKENGHETLISFFAQGFIAHEGWSADAWSANNCSSEYLFDEYTFLDGSPVGRRKDN